MGYGYCPTCGAPGVKRTRGIPSYDTCENGHIYPASDALAKPKDPTTAIATILSSVEPAHHPAGGGAMVIAVSDHVKAQELVAVLGPRMKGTFDEGIRVLPFGASALAYSPPGASLFRALICVPPRDGPISVQAFDAWIERAVVPYLAPLAPRIVL